MTGQAKTDRPTWEAYWATVGNENYLAAKALLELSHSVRGDAEQWLEWRGDRHHDDAPSPTLDWDGWIADVDAGRAWSSTELGLFRIVAALAARDDRAIPLRGTLGYLGSWETDVWRILVEWGTGGNNRDAPGRATVISA